MRAILEEQTKVKIFANDIFALDSENAAVSASRPHLRLSEAEKLITTWLADGHFLDVFVSPRNGGLQGDSFCASSHVENYPFLLVTARLR